MNLLTKELSSLPTRDVRAVLYDSQYTKKHESYIKELKEFYKHAKFADFLAEFIHCLKVSFIHPESNQLVENSLNFASKFVVSLSNNVDEDQMCPLLDGTLQFLFENHECDNYLVRFRVCHFLNKLFNNMGREAYLNEEVFEKIKTCMSERLQDKVPKVRAEAVYALHRLQDPSDLCCDITTEFLYHMKCDPSYEVRCAIVRKIAVNRKTLPFVLTRILDVKDVVRKAAYIVLSNLTVQRFSIRQRQTILDKGLNDKFAMVRNFVGSKILPAWLDAYNSNYIEFLQSINVECFTDIGMKALKKLFEIQHIVPLASMGIDDKLIPYYKLSSERVFVWRAVAEYLKPTSESSEENALHFNNVLPDFTPFTKYIRQYFFPSSIAEKENAPTEFVLTQLLHMCKLYDFSDEMGRLSLKDLCMDLLLSSRISTTTTKVIAQLLPLVVPDLNTRLSFMVEIVSELREPLTPMNASCVNLTEMINVEISSLEFELFQLLSTEHDENDLEYFENIRKIQLDIKQLEHKRENLHKPLENTDEDGHTCKNDTATLLKCLTIVTVVLSSEDVTEMNPILHSLLQNFILPLIDREVEIDNNVSQLALQALGMLCIIDQQLAIEKFLMLCFHIANESVSITSLKAIFDLLLCHGLDVFNIEEPTGDYTDYEIVNGDKKRKTNLIHLLLSLLDSHDPLMRVTTLQGLCKLIYAKRIGNPYLLIRLIALWFNAKSEEDAQISQSLTVFFSLFITNHPNAFNMTLDCFITILKAFSEGENEYILGKVDLNDVTKLMINLTRPNIKTYNAKNDTHNLLAIQICKVVLESNKNSDMRNLIKTLLDLDLNFKYQEEIENIKTDVNKIKMLLEKSGDKTNLKFVAKLALIIDGKQGKFSSSESAVENTLNSESVSTFTSKTYNASDRTELISQKEIYSSSEENVSECESYQSSPIQSINGEGIVIPETSDSEIN